MNQLASLKNNLRKEIIPERAAMSPRFFKAGPGQYGEGDKFLGVTVPAQRLIAKTFKDLPLIYIERLLMSKWHEERLTALFILVGQFKKADEAHKKIIYEFYLAHTAWINNWDLVDSSAGYIVGNYLDNKPEKMEVLTRLARSESLWERRIAVISTLYYIVEGRAEEALDIIKIVIYDSHDLIQKAAGWMLREIGKRVDRQLLLDFLDEYARDMPRTTLRYAIEHLSPAVKQKYMSAARAQA